jgi:PKD domain
LEEEEKNMKKNILRTQKAVVLTIAIVFLTIAFSPAIPSLQSNLSSIKATMTIPHENDVVGNRGWYWKPAYPNYAPNGIPDFDQQQDTWKTIEPGPNGVINSVPAGDDFLNVTENRIVPGQDCHLQTGLVGDDISVWAFCGPAAIANCFWWYDSKFSDPAGTPGDGKDNFPLVANYGAGDDHARGNVPLLIERLARAMKTNIKGTTYINDMNSSIHQWFVNTSLTNHFTVNTTNYVTFPYVEQQIENCQDVILLVGAYHQNITKTVDQQQPVVGPNDNLQPQNWWDFQSFTPSVSRLDAIQICLVSNGGQGSQCDVQVTVYGAFGGPALGTSILNPGFLGAATWIQFHFTPYIPLTPGALYYFDVREVPTPDAYHYEWFYAQPPLPNDPYPSGQGWMNSVLQPPNFDWTFKTEYYGGHRVAGHFLTCAGVDSANLKIAVSDPINDVQNPTVNHTSHNNAQNVSHDIYNVSVGSPYPNLPYHWWLSGYPDAGNVTVVEQAVVVCSSNNNPNKPTKPSGQTQGTPNTEYTYTTSTTDTDGDQVYYLFDWGDGTNSSWVGPYASGATGSAKHTWTSSGTYQVKVKVKDTLQAQSNWSDALSVKINTSNNPPNKPAKPSGNGKGKIKVEYTYTTSTTDPDGDQVYYLFDWGDGTNSSWVGPYAPGATGSAKHTWTVKGSYQIKVKAKDTNGAESPWSDPLSITMPISINIQGLQFLGRLLERFPNALPILRQLLGY